MAGSFLVASEYVDPVFRWSSGRPIRAPHGEQARRQLVRLGLIPGEQPPTTPEMHAREVAVSAAIDSDRRWHQQRAAEQAAADAARRSAADRLRDAPSPEEFLRQVGWLAGTAVA